MKKIMFTIGVLTCIFGFTGCNYYCPKCSMIPYDRYEYEYKFDSDSNRQSYYQGQQIGESKTSEHKHEFKQYDVHNHQCR